MSCQKLAKYVYWCHVKVSVKVSVFFFQKIVIYLCVCVCVGRPSCMVTHVWKPENNFWESFPAILYSVSLVSAASWDHQAKWSVSS